MADTTIARAVQARPQVVEEITRAQLGTLERALDQLFAAAGIDVEFSKHFFDRVNDARNGKPITVDELSGIFREVWEKHRDTLAKAKVDWKAIIQDLTSAINIPIVMSVNQRGEVELVAKTVMRKKGFAGREKRLHVTSKVEGLDEMATKLLPLRGELYRLTRHTKRLTLKDARDYVASDPYVRFEPTDKEIALVLKALGGKRSGDVFMFEDATDETARHGNKRSHASRVRAYKKSGKMVAQTFASPGAVGRSNSADAVLAQRIEGIDAYSEGKSHSSNPYPKGSSEAAGWSAGWLTSWRTEGFPKERDESLEEGIDDKYILKAVFMTGGAGAGKSFIADQMFGGMGLKVVNSDDQLERAMKAAGLDLKRDMPSAEVQREGGLRDKAKRITDARQRGYVIGRLGLIIDSTAAKVAKVEKQVATLRALGYDCYMVFVNTSLETALARNQARPRTVPENIARQDWEKVQKNLSTYKQMFGPANFREVKNDAVLTPREVTAQLMPQLTRVAMGLLNRPVQNPIGKAWMEQQLQGGSMALAASYDEPRGPMVSEDIVLILGALGAVAVGGLLGKLAVRAKRALQDVQKLHKEGKSDAAEKAWSAINPTDRRQIEALLSTQMRQLKRQRHEGVDEANEEFWDALLSKVKKAAGRRDWSSIPSSMQADAVKTLYDRELKTHLRGLIPGRIAVSQATTFDELQQGLERAREEHNKRLDKSNKKQESVDEAGLTDFKEYDRVVRAVEAQPWVLRGSSIMRERYEKMVKAMAAGNVPEAMRLMRAFKLGLPGSFSASESLDEAKPGRMFAYLMPGDREYPKSPIRNQAQAQAWLVKNFAAVATAPMPKDMGSSSPDDYDASEYVVKIGGKSYIVYVGEDFVQVYQSRTNESLDENDEWQSVRGVRKVTGKTKVGGQDRLVISTAGERLPELVAPEELEAMKTFDGKQLASRAKMQAAAQAAAAVAAANAFDDGGFTTSMSPLKAGKARDALSATMRVSGKMGRRGDLIRDLVKKGHRVETQRGKRRLIGKDGAFYEERDLTKTGLDFAEYLSRRSESIDEAALRLWGYNRVTGLWEVARSVTEETAQQWLATWNRSPDAKHSAYRLSKNTPRGKPTDGEIAAAQSKGESIDEGADRFRRIALATLKGSQGWKSAVEHFKSRGEFGAAEEKRSLDYTFKMANEVLAELSLSAKALSRISRWPTKDSTVLDTLVFYSAMQPKRFILQQLGRFADTDESIDEVEEENGLTLDEHEWLVMHDWRDAIEAAISDAPAHLVAEHAQQIVDFERAEHDLDYERAEELAETLCEALQLDEYRRMTMGDRMKRLRAKRTGITQAVKQGTVTRSEVKRENRIQRRELKRNPAERMRQKRYRRRTRMHRARVRPMAQAKESLDETLVYNERAFIKYAARDKFLEFSLADRKVPREALFNTEVRGNSANERRYQKIYDRMVAKGQIAEMSDENLDEARDLDDAAKKGEWTLKIWRGQRTKWSYFLENPEGGGSGTTTETSSVERLVQQVLSRSQIDRPKVYVVVGPSNPGIGESRRVSREFWADAKTGKIIGKEKETPAPQRSPKAAAKAQSVDPTSMIQAGDAVVIVSPQGQQRTGKAVMRGPAGWVLNMGGAHGTPGIASVSNIVQVKRGRTVLYSALSEAAGDRTFWFYYENGKDIIASGLGTTEREAVASAIRSLRVTETGLVGTAKIQALQHGRYKLKMQESIDEATNAHGVEFTEQQLIAMWEEEDAATRSDFKTWRKQHFNESADDSRATLQINIEWDATTQKYNVELPQNLGPEGSWPQNVWEFDTYEKARQFARVHEERNRFYTVVWNFSPADLIRFREPGSQPTFEDLDEAVRVSATDPMTMTAGQINRELDRLDKLSSKLNDALIEAGRGHDTYQDIVKAGDPLSKDVLAVSMRQNALRGEAKARYGPGLIGRLPTGKGFGPRKGAHEAIDEADDAETAKFHKQLLHARSSPAKRKQLGYSVEEIDYLTALMSNGSHKEDALYALKKYGPGRKYESIDEAKVEDVFREMGRKAFAAGKKRVPALDKEVVKALKGLGGDTVKALDAWLKGWDRANLDAPMESLVEGTFDFTASVPASDAVKLMQVVRAYADRHIVGSAGDSKGKFVVNGQLSDTKGRKGNFIDGIAAYKIGGEVRVGGRKVN